MASRSVTHLVLLVLFAGLLGLSGTASAAVVPEAVRAANEHVLTADAVAKPANPGFVAAPRPDLDMQAPRSEDKARPVLRPVLLLDRIPYRGESFIPDASSEIDQRVRRLPLPGFSLNVPLY